jgi:hypothetical protein
MLLALSIPQFPIVFCQETCGGRRVIVHEAGLCPCVVSGTPRQHTILAVEKSVEIESLKPSRVQPIVPIADHSEGDEPGHKRPAVSGQLRRVANSALSVSISSARSLLARTLALYQF